MKNEYVSKLNEMLKKEYKAIEKECERIFIEASTYNVLTFINNYLYNLSYTVNNYYYLAVCQLEEYYNDIFQIERNLNKLVEYLN